MALLLNFLALDDVDSALEPSAFNAEAAQFLYEGGFADPVAPANLNIFGFPLVIELLKHFCDLFPFAIHARSLGVSHLDIDVISFSQSRGQIHELPFAHLDNFLRCLSDIHFKVFEKLHGVLHHLSVDICDPFAIRPGAYKSLYQLLTKFEFCVLYFIIVLDSLLKLLARVGVEKLIVVALFELVELVSRSRSDR